MLGALMNRSPDWSCRPRLKIRAVPVHHLSFWQWPADIEALGMSAAYGGQLIKLCFGFDSFCNRVDIHMLRDCKERAGGLLLVCAVVDVRDVGSIDFDAINKKAMHRLD